MEVEDDLARLRAVPNKPGEERDGLHGGVDVAPEGLLFGNERRQDHRNGKIPPGDDEGGFTQLHLVRVLTRLSNRAAIKELMEG
jgi:hypothetical protein